MPSWGTVCRVLPERNAVPEPCLLVAQLSPQCGLLAPVPKDSEESRSLPLTYMADL